MRRPSDGFEEGGIDHSWTCSCCGRSFNTLPMDYAVHAPRNWLGLPEAERETRAKLSDDLCIIDDTEHYVRGCLEIPVLDSPDRFVWGVWVSVSKASFRRILELWNAPVVENEPPRFGWLSTWLEGYPEPIETRCRVHIRVGHLRPRIELEPTGYPLAVEQQSGITLARVKEIAALAGHK